MRSNSLIDDLVTNLTPVTPRRAGQDAGLLALVGLAELALYLVLGRIRPDMADAMIDPAMWWKLAGLAALAVAATVAAVGALDPSRNARGGMRLAAALGVALLATGWALDAMSGTGGTEVGPRLNWQMGLDCFTAVLLLSAPPVLGFAWLMRRGAATDGARASWLAGLASAAWGAFVFAFHCPSDDPLYIAVWYGAAVAVVAVACRWALPRLSRW